MAGELENIGQCDHGVSSEYLIFGPPGSGKTTSLASQVRRAADRFTPDRVLVTSFSRGAAEQLVGHDLPVRSDQIGTLHSRCFHALGRPSIAEVHVAEWNRANRGLQLTAVRTQHSKLEGENGAEEEPDGRGDVLLQALNRCRGVMAPPDAWPPEIQGFECRWKDYKRYHGLLDFCDLIETAVHDLPAAPGLPAVIVADEAQDLNPLQSRLIANWGACCEYFVRAGDDDQTIYSFAGATPETMLSPELPEDHKVILEKSYRLPGAVRVFAEQLIHRVSRRQEKEYRPRAEQGAVHRISSGYRSPEYGILRSAMDHLSRGKSVMFLASCSYMLRPLIQVLRKHAVPFHNPYRRSVGFWNPLRSGNRGSAASRIRALLSVHPASGERRLWTYAEFKSWSEWLIGTGILNEEVLRAAWPALSKQNVTMDYLAKVFDPKALPSLQNALARDYNRLLNWWRSAVHPDFRPRVQFPSDVAARQGPATLVENPKVIVGTIHSVKGGQADVVYLFPDLSSAGDANYRRSGTARDSVIRLFYVGATRARETLYICGRSSSRAVSL